MCIRDRDNTLLCELAAHPDFPRLMADLEIYVNGTALKQAQGANAIVDTMSATAVSYTHLDVYKRQAYTSLGGEI